MNVSFFQFLHSPYLPACSTVRVDPRLVIKSLSQTLLQLPCPRGGHEGGSASAFPSPHRASAACVLAQYPSSHSLPPQNQLSKSALGALGVRRWEGEGCRTNNSPNPTGTGLLGCSRRGWRKERIEGAGPRRIKFMEEDVSLSSCSCILGPPACLWPPLCAFLVTPF